MLALDVPRAPLARVEVLIGGIPRVVYYAGAQPGSPAGQDPAAVAAAIQ